MTAPVTAERARAVLAAMLEHQASGEFADLFGIDDPVAMSDTRLVLDGTYRRDGRPGGIIPGPVQMALADSFGWMLAVAPLPPGSDALTIDMSMQFLRPLPVGAFHAECELLRRGARRAVVTVRLSAGAGQAPSTFVTAAFVPRPAAPDPDTDPAHGTKTGSRLTGG